jgi:hypothetical protein
MLAKLGLLNDVPACTNLTTKPRVIAAGVDVLNHPIFAQDNIATAGGCLTSHCIAAWIVTRLEGKGSVLRAPHYVAPVGEKEDYIERAWRNITHLPACCHPGTRPRANRELLQGRRRNRRFAPSPGRELPPAADSITRCSAAPSGYARGTGRLLGFGNRCQTGGADPALNASHAWGRVAAGLVAIVDVVLSPEEKGDTNAILVSSA